MFHSFFPILPGSGYTQQLALPLLHRKQLEHNVTNSGGHQGRHITTTLLDLHVHISTLPSSAFAYSPHVICKKTLKMISKMLMIVSSAIRHLLIICRCESETESGFSWSPCSSDSTRLSLNNGCGLRRQWMEALIPLVFFHRDNESLNGISEEGLLQQRPGNLLMV